MAELSLKESLNFCTTKIDAQVDEKRMSYGTGFFFNLELNEKSMVPVIITNKHVACGKQNLTFYLSQQSADGTPAFLSPIKLTLGTEELKNNLYEHPDPEVDLCAITVNPVITKAKSMGYKPFYRAFSNENIATKEQLESLEGIEEVEMIGYPNALWDHVHNMPIVRKGITATWPVLDFNGKREFLIDAACFPGSSGSPVFICDTGLYYSKVHKDTVLGNRFMLLGIQHAVPVRTADGSIVKKTIDEVDVKLEDKYEVKTESMLNLGFIIKSECILDLIPVIKKDLGIK